jgi:hypothetical protein
MNSLISDKERVRIQYKNELLSNCAVMVCVRSHYGMARLVVVEGRESLQMW